MRVVRIDVVQLRGQNDALRHTVHLPCRPTPCPTCTMSMGSLSPPPAYVAATGDSKPILPIDHIKHEPEAGGSNSGSGTSGSLTPIDGASPVKLEPIDLDADVDVDEKPFNDQVKVEEHKRLYAEEEKKLRAQEAPPAERLQDE